MKKHRTIIYITGFLFSIPTALTAYMGSSFLGLYFNEAQVSAIFIIGHGISIFGLLEMPKILSYFGNRIALILFNLLHLFSLIFLSSSSDFIILIGAFIVHIATGNFIISCLDIFLEDFSKSSMVGRIRGFFLMLVNLAWVIAEIVSGYLISKSGFSGVYLLSASFIILTILILLATLRDFKDPIYQKIDILKTIRVFLKDKNLLRIYSSNLTLRFFFAWMIIYTPIYLNKYLEFSWEQIGIMFAIMLTPFVILDPILGISSDKIGEKKMLMAGFLITAISTFLIPFFTTPKFWIFAALLFATRVGAATIEVMNESYFFKSVNKQETDLISFFRNTTPLSFIVGPLLGIVVLDLVPNFKDLFFVLSGILLLGFFMILKLKDIK